MVYNFISHPCIRINNISSDELHPCFFCGYEIDTTSLPCSVCGLKICQSCGKCFCSGTKSEKHTIVLVHEKYCQSYSNLFFFNKIDVGGDNNIIENMQTVLEYCSRKLRSEKKLKLNVGCGMDLREGYLNIDLQDIDARGYRFIKTDCGNLSFLGDKSVSEIYAKGLIEHIHPAKLGEYLYEWQRVLEVGGILILIYPDFDKIVSQYELCREGGKYRDYLLFLRLVYATLNPSTQSLVRSDPHRNLITTAFLTPLLESEGYEIVEIRSFGSTQEKLYTSKLTARKVRLD